MATKTKLVFKIKVYKVVFANNKQNRGRVVKILYWSKNKTEIDFEYNREREKERTKLIEKLYFLLIYKLELISLFIEQSLWE